MGTVSFTGLFPGMRISKDFIVYPMQDSGTEIMIQGGNRFGRLDLANGAGVISAGTQAHNGSEWLHHCQIVGTAKDFTLSPEDLQTLRQWIKSTGGLLVGSSIVKCDNTGALAL